MASHGLMLTGLTAISPHARPLLSGHGRCGPGRTDRGRHGAVS